MGLRDCSLCFTPIEPADFSRPCGDGGWGVTNRPAGCYKSSSSKNSHIFNGPDHLNCGSCSAQYPCVCLTKSEPESEPEPENPIAPGSDYDNLDFNGRCTGRYLMASNCDGALCSDVECREFCNNDPECNYYATWNTGHCETFGVCDGMSIVNTFEVKLYRKNNGESGCTMSLDNVYSRKTDCSNYLHPQEGSWESCSKACLENPDCIGLQTDNPWNHCEMILNDSVEDCPDGSFTFYPKVCGDATKTPLLDVCPETEDWTSLSMMPCNGFVEGLTCMYGEECCCGNCSPSFR